MNVGWECPWLNTTWGGKEWGDRKSERVSTTYSREQEDPTARTRGAQRKKEFQLTSQILWHPAPTNGKGNVYHKKCKVMKNYEWSHKRCSKFLLYHIHACNLKARERGPSPSRCSPRYLSLPGCSSTTHAVRMACSKRKLICSSTAAPCFQDEQKQTKRILCYLNIYI